MVPIATGHPKSVMPAIRRKLKKIFDNSAKIFFGRTTDQAELKKRFQNKRDILNESP